MNQTQNEQANKNVITSFLNLNEPIEFSMLVEIEMLVKLTLNETMASGPAESLYPPVTGMLIQKSIHVRFFLNFHIAPLSMLNFATCDSVSINITWLNDGYF